MIGFKEFLEESTMHKEYNLHVAPHIKAYKAGKIGPDTLGNRVTAAHKKIAARTGRHIDVVAKAVNTRVDHELEN